VRVWERARFMSPSASCMADAMWLADVMPLPADTLRHRCAMNVHCGGTGAGVMPHAQAAIDREACLHFACRRHGASSATWASFLRLTSATRTVSCLRCV
jgi:hypothetical protein